MEYTEQLFIGLTRAPTCSSCLRAIRLWDYGILVVQLYSLMKTVVHFSSQSPPVAMFICGDEGEWQRVLLCSYDSNMDAFQRQTVLRLP